MGSNGGQGSVDLACDWKFLRLAQGLSAASTEYFLDRRKSDCLLARVGVPGRCPLHCIRLDCMASRFHIDWNFTSDLC